MKAKYREALLMAGLGGILASCKNEGPTVAPAVLSLEATVPAACGCDGPPPFPALSGVVGKPTAITLVVVDQNGLPVPNVSVRWAVVSGGGFTDVASSVSTPAGTATAQWTLDTIAKLDSLYASLPSGLTVLATAIAKHDAAATATKVSGDSQTIAAGATAAPFILKVADRYGNGISGVVVAWSVAGGGTLSVITTTTDANGVAQTALTTAATPGAYRVIATLGVMPAITFMVAAN